MDGTMVLAFWDLLLGWRGNGLIPLFFTFFLSSSLLGQENQFVLAERPEDYQDDTWSIGRLRLEGWRHDGGWRCHGIFRSESGRCRCRSSPRCGC